MVEEKIKSIIDSLSNSSNENIIESICLSLASSIKADFVFVAELDESKSMATTIVLVEEDKIIDNISYELKGTPCENACSGNVCTHISHTQRAYPKDQLLINMNIAGYIGIPLNNQKGEVQAILVALYREEIRNEKEVTSLFLLFSGLIVKELEKNHLISELEIRNEIIEKSREVIVITDKNNNISSVNRAFTQITGYSFREVEGKNPNILASERHSADYYQEMWNELSITGSWAGEIWNERKDGTVYPEWLSINTICDENNEVQHYVAFFFDISKRKAREEKIYRQANYDLLTDVANRFYFMEALNRVIESFDKQRTLLFLDLDLFKEINDVHGHAFGDALLKKIADRLASLITPSDLLARMSGDGFAILMKMSAGSESIDDLVTRLLFEFSKPFYIDEIQVVCTLSVGIVHLEDENDDAGTIIKKAEHAMYHAKDNGRNSFSFYTEDMRHDTLHKMKLKNELTQAINERKLSVVFQPIVSTYERAVKKFEVLVRWNNDGQWISPEEFIPIAEQSAQIKEVGEFVLSEACRQLKKLRDLGYNDIVFNVNRSVYEIPLTKSENDHWLILINMHGLKPNDICFELTESALAPDKRNNETLFNLLREAGCTIALDDFGTGYSSLGYIRRIPIDYIKIDKSFISDMSTNEDDNILVSTIIAMSKSLGKKVVAEGVETREQLDLLTSLGCDYIQGYFFSKPLEPCELTHYLNKFCYDKKKELTTNPP